ncbi:MAG: two-component sensor histidine kinase [Bacteroidetes bacterium]|nr:two-component sensor histidine kinase [Bacteroidota bacterium]MBS1973865.1 two-component sensor histidine kinase [Bacteroidota bacterium]
MLVYIIAALVWWFIALQQQNNQMMNYRLEQLKQADSHFIGKSESIRGEAKRKTVQYIGEGSTFLLLIMITAAFVYRAVRRQLKVQQQQQNFMMAVTHELKTPIAVAKLNLETLQRYELDEEKRKRMIGIALLETNRLNALAGNILVSSQLEGGNYKMLKEEIDFSGLAQNLVNDYIRRFPEKNWQPGIEPNMMVKGDPLLLQMLLNNLLENAVKYSPKNALIAVELKKEAHNIFLKIKDEGYGVPDAEKKKIFGKFYRIGNESTRTAQGTGLGLYLCNKIAKDHSAHIAVTDNSPAGSIFTVKF